MTADGSTAAGDRSAGRLLREARERQGLHIAALAAAIKVQQKKLEALETDRHDLLPDATFVRALAQTVCRALKIDATEVMRRLPPPAAARLGPVGEGLNTPFRDRASGPLDRSWRATAAHPAVWVTVLILGAAAAVLLWPEPLSNGDRASAAITPGGAFVPAPSAGLAPSPAASESAVAGSAPTTVVPETPAVVATATPAAVDAPSVATSAPAVAVAVADAASDASAVGVTGTVVVRVRADTWVGVTDARGTALVGRTLKAGEAVGVDGAPPFKVRIGNAVQSELVFRGQPVALAQHTRDNVARLELR